MIHLEIISSPDSSVVANFQFYQNELYLGRQSGNLLIQDPELYDTHLMIEVVEKDLIVHPQKNVQSYLIDGKRASTIRKIKAGQKITIGSTCFRVLAFEETQFASKKALLDEKLAALVEANSQRLIVIEKLARLMK